MITTTRPVLVTTWICCCWLLAADGVLGSARAVEPEPRVETYRRVGGRALRAYLFPPQIPSGDRPVAAVLLFHGGGWTAGEPEWTFSAARRFSASGMVAISIEYRLSRGNDTPIEALDDVCAAFRWARKRAGELGLDPERVAGYGVSAGGHLIAAAATVGCPGEAGPKSNSQPDALLLWSPALDIVRDGWFVRLLQGRASPDAYSPDQHVRSTTPPTSIVHGSADTLTPLSGAERFCQRLIELGGTCQLNVYEGLGHLLTRNLAYQEGDFDPDPQAVADGVERHLEFLRQLGFIAGAPHSDPR